MSIDPQQLPDDPKQLQRIVLDLMAQLDRELAERTKVEHILRELMDAKRGRKSEQLSEDQLSLFAAALQTLYPETADQKDSGEGGCEPEPEPEADTQGQRKRSGGRRPLPAQLKRERVVHDLAQQEKHCDHCGQDLRQIGEQTSERYEYVPAKLIVIEDVCLKYACQCTVRTANKPSQPLEKSTAGASLLAQVIVGKFGDHLPLNRQETIFGRHGAEISRKTMCGWMGKCANLLDPLYQAAKTVLFESKVIGTDDTGVKVLDPKLDFTRTGRIWPYLGDKDHPIILYDYTPTREGAGPEKFLEGYRGYLQADAYAGYDALFKDPRRGLIEVGCWAHGRRHFHEALESDTARMGPVLALIAKLYAVEHKARTRSAAERLALRQLESKPVLEQLHGYLLELKGELLPKSAAAGAVRYALNHWVALTRYCQDGDLEIDNNATERALRSIAVGRNNWTFFGSDNGGKTAAVLRSFVACCQRSAVEPFAWFNDVLSRIAGHPVTRLAELLPHNWSPAKA